jgi:hypothetical protein
MASELVKQDSDAVDGSDALEVSLDLFWGRAVVDVSDEDAARIDIFLWLSNIAWHGLVKRVFHIAELLGLGLHIRDTLPHISELCVLLRIALLRIEFLWIALALIVPLLCLVIVNNAIRNLKHGI